MASEMTPDPFEELSGSPTPAGSDGKKSWQELRQAVKKTRRLATALINRVPHSFTFRHINTEQGLFTRVYFLGVPSGNRENTLLYVDVSYDSDDDDDNLEWKSLLQSFHATPAFGQFSKEEQLLRERKRLGSFGITSYDYDDSSGSFAFSACSSVYHCVDVLNPTDGSFSNQQMCPSEAKTCNMGTRLDPKICPTNSDLLAYICSNDIWVTNLQTGHEKRLTFTQKGLKRLSEEPLSAGVPSFVVQEEFDRYTGYWWQPVETPSDPEGERTYRILYEEVDESEVEILHIASASSEDKDVDEYRYPRAGTPNAKCTLKLLQFQFDEEGNICCVEERQLPDPLWMMFSWMEYIPRAGWTPDGCNTYVQLLDRQQQKLQLVLIPLNCFSYDPNMDIDMDTGDSSNTLQVIYEDTSHIWVNVHDILYFFPQETASELCFIWASEKSGYRHLYLVTSQLTSCIQAGQDSAMDMVDKHRDCFKANVLSEVALMSGDWEICGKQIWVDTRNKLVYFIGLKDTPLETHLYVVSYDNPQSVIRLTEPGFSHTVTLDKDCSMFVTVYSSVTQAPASQMFQLIKTPNTIIAHSLGCLQQPTENSEEYHPPEIFQYPSTNGHTMYGMYYRPHNAQVDKKYPTLLFVYGGPQVQLVTNAYKGIRFLRLHTLASLGYMVVVIDSRGSSHRGLLFESPIKLRLGSVEIEDQVEGLHWLANHTQLIDLNRVAIHGWSYGGYLSLMGLAQRPDVFKVAIAGAPVTCWYLYDTGYTERYMDLPVNNQSGYKAGSVLDYVEKFPSDGNRLLIVHGLIDENVHFAHTAKIVNALIKACKPYQLQVYPNERHGIRQPDASEHYETMVLNFLQQNL